MSGNCNQDPNCSCTKTKTIKEDIDEISEKKLPVKTASEIFKGINELVKEFKNESEKNFIPPKKGTLNLSKFDEDLRLIEESDSYGTLNEARERILKDLNIKTERPEPSKLYNPDGQEDDQEDDHCLVGFAIDAENGRIKNQKEINDNVNKFSLNVSTFNPNIKITTEEVFGTEPIDPLILKKFNYKPYVNENSEIRLFDTGATRDTDVNKLGYSGFLSPLVLKEFAEYMNLNRKMADGSVRSPDNWQKLFGEHHEDVCTDSLLRHTMDVWLINRGFPNEAREDIKKALCAIMFNAQAYLFKILKEEYENRKE